MSEFSELKKVIKEDALYAKAWHDNLFMAVYDSVDPNDLANKDINSVANEAAARFMKRTFDVDTSHAYTDFEEVTGGWIDYDEGSGCNAWY